MNIGQFLKTYFVQGTEPSPTVQRWTRRVSLAAAVVVPGLPQILSRKHLFLAGIVFLLGTGAIVNMVLGPIFLSGDEIKAFDVFYAVAIPNLSNIFPMRIDPGIASSQNLTPILREEELTFVQPLYWELLTVHIILYIGCALISVRDQWKILRDSAHERDKRTLP